ncbi:unnamed protein product [Urochloa decumbens]|uniref:Transcription repressor n=1 Tax=Urochloa decumbens TaxID=240449 RepID=A0ABC9BTZ9_9POAL
MVKKQKRPVGGLTSLFSSSSSNKQLDTSPTPGAVLPCQSSSSSMSSSSDSAWQWASCGLHPRTLSFRQQEEEEEDANGDGRHQHHDNDSHMAMMKQQTAYYYKTMNSAYSVDSCFSSNSLASQDSFSAASDAEAEAVIRAVCSDRLLFKPEEASSFKATSKKLIIKAADEDYDKDNITASKAATAAFGGGMAMTVDSQNPYRDFRESMEAMVMSQQQQGDVKGWCWLEEMLGWYLRANGKSTHGIIIGAFVDLLVALGTTATSPADSSSPSTPAAANCSPSSDCACSSSSSL